jgi:hypothetical protein
VDGEILLSIASKNKVIETKDALLASKQQEIEHYKQEIARLIEKA